MAFTLKKPLQTLNPGTGRNEIDRLSASPSTAGVTNYAKVLGLFAESSASSDISHTSGGASTSISWPV